MERELLIKPWFFAINEFGLVRYMDMIKVAVKSKNQTNPDIKAYCIYDGELNDSTKWMEDNGVTILQHRVSFADVLEARHTDPIDRAVALGAYLRIEVPLLIQKHNISSKNYIYTDSDIVFLKTLNPELFDIDIKTIAVTYEFSPSDKHFNSGVMLASTSKMIEDYPLLVQYIKDNINTFTVYDQSALNGFYPEYSRQKLSPKYNHKGYWPFDPDAKILHFHGAKPNQFPPFLEKSTVCDSIKHLTGNYFPEYCKQWFKILNS